MVLLVWFYILSQRKKKQKFPTLLFSLKKKKKKKKKIPTLFLAHKTKQKNILFSISFFCFCYQLFNALYYILHSGTCVNFSIRTSNHASKQKIKYLNKIF